MNKCQIEITPNGDGRLRLILKSEMLSTPKAGMPFDRPRDTALVATQLQQLRFGDASDALVQEVTAKISEWLLGQDLNGQIETAINISSRPNGEPIRLVFSVDDADIREQFADIPFELIHARGSGDPLVLNSRIASMVHVLDKTGAAAPRPSTWPLKILIVRSNPADLEGLIPPAEPIRQFILDMMATQSPPLKPDLVKIDILSSEAASNLAGRPTESELYDQLQKGYDILIYLGHGDITRKVTPETKIGGVLQLESETGTAHSNLEAKDLARMLGEPKPVPVVLLLGCLTATEGISQERQDEFRKRLPRWLRGSQGVAQVLINSGSGVQFVVGMRYKIDTEDATNFLNVFFRNLLTVTPGNVEAAVFAARQRLAKKSYMWSAPVIFSTLITEPIFPFMAESLECPTFDVPERLRQYIWTNLVKIKWSMRESKDWEDWAVGLRGNLQQPEMEIVQKVEQHKATLIAPGFVEVKAGSKIRVPVKLIGSLANIEEIEGKISVAGSFKIVSLDVSQHLSDSGFSLKPMVDNSEFLIRGDGPRRLASGDLFHLVIEVPTEAQGVFPVEVCQIKTKPPMRVCPGNNAIVVPSA